MNAPTPAIASIRNKISRIFKTLPDFLPLHFFASSPNPIIIPIPAAVIRAKNQSNRK